MVFHLLRQYLCWLDGFIRREVDFLLVSIINQAGSEGGALLWFREKGTPSGTSLLCTICLSGWVSHDTRGDLVMYDSEMHKAGAWPWLWPKGRPTCVPFLGVICCVGWKVSYQ